MKVLGYYGHSTHTFRQEQPLLVLLLAEANMKHHGVLQVAFAAQSGSS